MLTASYIRMGKKCCRHRQASFRRTRYCGYTTAKVPQHPCEKKADLVHCFSLNLQTISALFPSSPLGSL